MRIQVMGRVPTRTVDRDGGVWRGARDVPMFFVDAPSLARAELQVSDAFVVLCGEHVRFSFTLFDEVNGDYRRVTRCVAATATTFGALPPGAVYRLTDSVSEVDGVPDYVKMSRRMARRSHDGERFYPLMSARVWVGGP